MLAINQGCFDVSTMDKAFAEKLGGEMY